MNQMQDNSKRAIKRLGQNLRAARESGKRSQEDVASAAKIGRSTLLHVESGKGASLSKIVAIAHVLGADIVLVGPESAQSARRVARLEHDAKVQLAKEAHLRLAVLMLGDAVAGKPLIDDAKKTVRLWRVNKSCSEFYIKSWEALLSGSVREVGKSLGAIDERWSNALLQNTPFSNALFANRTDHMRATQ
jgi:transcriptional regulator with XRE-family HTH domain